MLVSSAREREREEVRLNFTQVCLARQKKRKKTTLLLAKEQTALLIFRMLEEYIYRESYGFVYILPPLRTESTETNELSRDSLCKQNERFLWVMPSETCGLFLY